MILNAAQPEVTKSRSRRPTSTLARLFASAATVVLLAGLYSPAATQGRKPNVVVILADDLGWTDVGYHGSEIRTPHLDRLAATGARLEHFYVQPVCSPTRAALMTGRYPLRYGLQVGVVRPWAQHGLPLEERTLPAALRQVGYTTAIVGKWHLGHFQRAYLPTARGFDIQYGHYNGAIDYFTHVRDGGHDWHRDDKASHEAGYATVLLGNEAVGLIERQPGDKPLFLYLAFNAPHTPLQAPPEYLDRYPDIGEAKRKTFAAMVSCLDDQVGRVLDALDRRAMTSETLILFASDNGGPVQQAATNGKLRSGKATLYEGGVRVPALASWPGRIKPGTVVNQPMHIVDWYPMLLKLAGASLEQQTVIDGRDIWPTITEGKPSPHDAILINANPVNAAIRAGDWKLVINGHRREAAEAEQPGRRDGSNRPEKVELFNLREDPSEENNLADQHPQKVRELRDRIAAYAAAATPPKAGPKPDGFLSPKVWGEPESVP